MRAEQTVSEMVVEVLARQAEELAARSSQDFHGAFEEVLQTEAGRQLCELVEGPNRHQKARDWQANLQVERVLERVSERESENARHLVTA